MSFAAIMFSIQAVTPPVAPERFSILAPVQTEPCRRQPLPTPEEVVVCATVIPTQRLPLPAERGPPDRPTAVNPYLRPDVAMNAAAAPCATVQGGCQVGVDMIGVGVGAVRLLGKLIDPNSCCNESGQATNAMALARDVVGSLKGKKKVDKSNRVAIPLEDPPVPRITGTVPTEP
jgi:hypothetical protein